MISANSLTAAVQGQFMFVLPWMLLARGSSPQVAALAGAFIYVPMLLTALPAGAYTDHADPLWLMRIVTAISLAACALYPVATLFGKDWFALVPLAAVVVGAMRNLTEGAVFRGLAETTQGTGLLRAHAIRQTVNQAALFSTAFIGLLLFKAGDAKAVLAGICLLYVAALAILAIVPQFGYERDPDTRVRDRMSSSRAITPTTSCPRRTRRCESCSFRTSTGSMSSRATTTTARVCAGRSRIASVAPAPTAVRSRSRRTGGCAWASTLRSRARFQGGSARSSSDGCARRSQSGSRAGSSSS